MGCFSSKEAPSPARRRRGEDEDEPVTKGGKSVKQSGPIRQSISSTSNSSISNNNGSSNNNNINNDNHSQATVNKPGRNKTPGRNSTPRTSKHHSPHGLSVRGTHGQVRPCDEIRDQHSGKGQRRRRDHEDGDWDNLETVFNLDDVENAQLAKTAEQSAVDTQGSSVVAAAFQNSLLASKSSLQHEDQANQNNRNRVQNPLAMRCRETPLLRIEKLKGCMFVNQYLVLKYLGRGACGKVFLCLNVQDFGLYAMKAVRKSDLQTSRNQAQKRNPMEDLKREIMIMKKMKHPNIVTLSEVIDDPSGSKLLLVMEYMEGGPIMTREALERCERLSEEQVARNFRDMVKALDYLHSQRVVHGDLKPENVLMSATGQVKLSDFGCSKVIVSGNEYLERCNGTPAFLAPEMMKPNSRYRGRPTDIYAMGACLYTLVYGRIPFTAPNLYQLFQVVQNEEVTFPESVPVSESLKDLLKQLLTKNPKERITLSEVRHHPWVTGQGRYPVPRWDSDQANQAPAQDETSHKYKEAIAQLASQCVRERVFQEGEALLRQGDTGSYIFFIVSGECEVLLKCSMPIRRTNRGHHVSRKQRGSGDSGDPLMNSSESSSSMTLNEEDRQARLNLVEASSKATKLIRERERGHNELHLGFRSAGDVVGEMALFSRESTRTATVRALTKMVVKIMSKEEVLNWFNRHLREKQYLREIIWKREGETVSLEGMYQLAHVHDALAPPPVAR